MKVNFFYFYREITCVHLGNLWTHLWVHACMLNCIWLCNSMNYSPPDSVVHELFQAKILKWVATSYTRGSSWPKDPSCVSCTSYTGRQVFSTAPLGKPLQLPYNAVLVSAIEGESAVCAHISPPSWTSHPIIF